MKRMYTLLSAILLMAGIARAQGINNNTKSKKMSTIQKNEEVIRKLYDECLNNKNFELLKQLFSPGYPGFQGPLIPLLNAFPDIHYKLEDLFGADDKVVARWTWQGTHTNQYNNFVPTGKTVSNDGMAIYQLKDEKIIGVQVQTDRLGFLQEMGALPRDVTQLSPAPKDAISFIDKFFVPAAAKAEFYERMHINRTFIKTIPGFIKDEAYESTDKDGNLICVTVAQWTGKEALNAAREVVQAEYKRQNFDMPAMLKRLNITIDRNLYTAVKD